MPKPPLPEHHSVSAQISKGRLQGGPSYCVWVTLRRSRKVDFGEADVSLDGRFPALIGPFEHFRHPGKETVRPDDVVWGLRRATVSDRKAHEYCGDYGGGDTACLDRSCFRLCWGEGNGCYADPDPTAVPLVWGPADHM